MVEEDRNKAPIVEEEAYTTNPAKVGRLGYQTPSKPASVHKRTSTLHGNPLPNFHSAFKEVDFNDESKRQSAINAALGS